MDDFTVLPVYGGSAYGPQLAGLRRGAQVVVGTPGRVIDHIAKGSLDLSELQYLVLDEADEMLRMGFAEDVEQIFQQTPRETPGGAVLRHHAEPDPPDRPSST